VNPGISTTDAREQGFEEGIAEYPNIEYLGAEYSENDPARAAEIVTATLAAEPQLSGIFGTNLFSAEGSATGLRQEGREDVSIVGFDAGPAQIDQLEEGLVQALIAQQPIDIGRQGIEQAVAALEGEPTEEEISTGFVTVTADNMGDPKALLMVHPHADRKGALEFPNHPECDWLLMAQISERHRGELDEVLGRLPFPAVCPAPKLKLGHPLRA
jgi:ABC-type sugar transport system substrate-binding protein